MAEVALVKVSKRYGGDILAVADIDLRVADGELMVLVGPSGSGKTTVLRLIAGLETPTAGAVHIGGRAANGLRPGERDVAMVFQDYALYPHMTVEQNIGFALRLRRVPREQIARRVAEAAGLLGIGDLLGRTPHTLSGGQQQRVALARAIVREPAVCLFDEPLSNLDARLRHTTRSEIKTLQKRLRTTAIYVTHDQEEAMSLGDRLAVMCDGRLQQIGRPLDVYRAPANRFVASFIGSPPMNFLEGRLERDGGAAVFSESGGGARIRLPDDWAAAVDDAAGREAVLGIRPQSLAASRDGDGPALSIEVELSEHLGETVDVVGRTPAGQRVIARLSARDGLEHVGVIRLAIDTAGTHLFEKGPFGANLSGFPVDTEADVRPTSHQP